MPLVFNCRLVCDSPACGNEQDAVAVLEGSVAALLTGQPRNLFKFSYDQTSGLQWRFFGDKTGCSPDCHVLVGAPEKSKSDP